MAVMTQSSHVRTSPAGWADPIIARPEPSRPARVVPLLVWSGCLLAALVLLLWLGAGRLATPPVTDPAAWWAWAGSGDPVIVVMAGLRVLALGLAWYLTGVTSVSVIARLLRAARLVRMADALSVGPVRVLTQQALGVGLAAGVLVTAVPSNPVVPDVGVAATDTPVPAAPIVSDVDAAGMAADAPGIGAAGVAGATTAVAPVPAPSAPQPEVSAPTASPDPGDSSTTAPSDEPARPESHVRERTVAPGDHFWSIAEEEVAAQLGRQGTEAEVRHHWRRLVASNTDRLVVAGQPDLLLPGQRIVVPEVGS